MSEQLAIDLAPDLADAVAALAAHNATYRPFTVPAWVCGCGPGVVVGPQTEARSEYERLAAIRCGWERAWEVEQDRLVALIPGGERIRYTRDPQARP